MFVCRFKGECRRTNSEWVEYLYVVVKRVIHSALILLWTEVTETELMKETPSSADRRLRGRMEDMNQWKTVFQSRKHHPRSTSLTSPLGLPAQNPFKLALEFLNWSPASLSNTSSPPPPPPSSPVFSPLSFISSRAMLNWVRVRTICSMWTAFWTFRLAYINQTTPRGLQLLLHSHQFSPVEEDSWRSYHFSLLLQDRTGIFFTGILPSFQLLPWISSGERLSAEPDPASRLVCHTAHQRKKESSSAHTLRCLVCSFHMGDAGKVCVCVCGGGDGACVGVCERVTALPPGSV